MVVLIRGEAAGEVTDARNASLPWLVGPSCRSAVTFPGLERGGILSARVVGEGGGRGGLRTRGNASLPRWNYSLCLSGRFGSVSGREAFGKK